MDTLTLQGTPDTTFTLLSNEFLDNYMPKASGEFVKVYLYFLRYCTWSKNTIRLSDAADTFCMTENDVLRALKYWEREGLIALSYTADNRLSGIRLLPVPAQSAAQSQNTATRQTAAPLPGQTPQSFNSASNTLAADAAAIAAPLGDFLPQSFHAGDSDTSASINMYNGTPAYTASQMEHFKKNQDDQLFFVIEQYLGKPLGPTDVNKIVFFGEQLGFSSDLIEYLFEYCVSNNHYSIHYIEKTALAWARDGIDTVAKARARCTYYNKTSFDILKAFGITNRNPAPSEMEHIRRWTREYGFPMTIILEACRRTIDTIHSPSFAYADKILKDWYENNVGSMDDIKKLDEAHDKKRQDAVKGAADASQTGSSPQSAQNSYRPSLPSKPGNKFHNFEQRMTPYNHLEQSLLEKTMKRTGGK